MKKKYLIVGMAVILGASLSFFGCESATDGTAGAAGAPGAPGPNNFNGTPSVQAILAAVASGAPVYLDNVTITGAGTLDFGTADVTVYGTLASSNSADPLYIIAGPNVKLADGASIAPGADDYFFGTEDHVAAAAAGATNVAQTGDAASLDTATGGVTGVKDLELSWATGGTGDKPAWYTNSSLKVFVYDTLTITGNAAAPDSAKVTAIGTVKLEPGSETAVTTLAVDTKVDVSAATIQYDDNATVAVTLPAALEVFAFKVTGEQGVLKVTGGTTSVEAAVTPNNGYVEFASAVTDAIITGSGRIRFKDGTDPTTFSSNASSISGSIIHFENGFVTPSGAAALTLDGAVSFPAAKTIAFGANDGSTLVLEKGSTVTATATPGSGTAVLTADSDLTITGYDTNASAVLAFAADGSLSAATKGIAFDGDVTFGKNLTLTEVPATFGGIATFADDAVITLTTADSVITLEAGAGLAVGEGKFPYNGVLSNSESADVTLTPEINTTLTFGDDRTITQDGTGTTHGITVGGTTATLSLPSGASYVVASAASKVGTLTVDNGNTLTLGFGELAGSDPSNTTTDDSTATIVLTGAATTDGASLAGAGSVVAGGTTIIGGQAGTASWQAVGTGTVTIAANAITASADTAVLTGTTGSTAPSITVAVENTLVIGANTAINVKEGGTITLAKHATDGGTLNLSATTAKITGLTGGGSDRTLTTSNIDDATYTVGTATGDITGGGTANAGNAWIGGGNDTGPNTIKPTDNSNDVAIDKDTTVGS